jgi:hypothetical protein
MLFFDINKIVEYILHNGIGIGIGIGIGVLYMFLQPV